MVKNRYSDEELKEFESIILEKLEKARADLRFLKSIYVELDDKNGVSDTSPTFKFLEEGCVTNSKELNSRLASRKEKFIHDLENALIRIKNKNYGICRITGKLIPKERLRSVPHATTSVEGKEQEAEKKRLESIPQGYYRAPRVYSEAV